MILYIFLVGSVIIFVQDNGFLSQLILRQHKTICCPLCSDIGHFGQKWFLTKNLNNESHPDCGKGVKDAQMHSNQCVCIFIRWIFQLNLSLYQSKGEPDLNQAEVAELDTYLGDTKSHKHTLVLLRN